MWFFHKAQLLIISVLFLMGSICVYGWAEEQASGKGIYDPGRLKPMDTRTEIKVGDRAPDFTLPGIDGRKVSLSDYRGKKNVVISFVPAAWTPVCSQQWPGYNIAQEIFDRHDAIIIGITVDNIPTLYSWTTNMGSVWFAVLSDFWPHGAVSKKYGVLRSDGVSERVLFLVDKRGIVRSVEKYDINALPRLQELEKALDKLPE